VFDLLVFLDEAYNRKSWHGPNLRSALKGVSAEEAAWRIAPGRHNIWELALHAAYWKFVARRRLTGEKSSFPILGSNFFQRPVVLTEAQRARREPSDDPVSDRAALRLTRISVEVAWKKDLGILAEEHRLLRAAVSSMKRQNAHQQHLIRGAAAHDLYHAGQIRLLRRLYSP
jgi:hypothetical protein